jgi:hypothetical protein
MSVAWYVVLEREIPGFDPFVNGKALAKAGDALDAIAKRSGVKPILSFFSLTPEMAAFAENEGALPSKVEETWYMAGEGLKTVRMLLQELEQNSANDPVVKDLEDFRRVLETLQQHNVRWHLAVDF